VKVVMSAMKSGRNLNLCHLSRAFIAKINQEANQSQNAKAKPVSRP